MKKCRGVLLGGLILSAQTAVAAPPDVPPDLQAWRAWALDGQEHRRCPFRANADTSNRDSFVCAWPERLDLAVTASGGRFAQRWTVYAESWVPLPGGNEHWPRDVTVNGNAAAVVAGAGSNTPQLRLAPGTHAIAGSFRWARRPEALAVSSHVGLVDLTVDGQRIALPERQRDSLWLGKRRTAQQQEQMEIQVYRRIDDWIPVRLTTLVRLQVAGEGREELLSAPLPEGFVPLSLQSPLPARIDPDGRVRVQARAGSWEITLVARGSSVGESLRRPKLAGPWAREEIWSFAADDRLRQVAVEGVDGVDPVQTGVPDGWRELPAYRMAPDSELRVVERSRGLSEADDNQLALSRRMWLDFDRRGYTVVDRIAGTMRQDWRLDVAEPQRLLNATSQNENLLITHGPAGNLTGIEVREPRLTIRAVSRIENAGAMSATGWQGRFASVDGVVQIPPGHRLLAVAGADDAPRSWIERWRLLDLFLVLIASAAVARLFGWPVGAVALVALVLTHHDNEGVMVWLWINLLIAYLLARQAPEGRLRRVAGFYRWLSAIVLLLALIPFAFQQVRLAIYPQLEYQYGSPGSFAAQSRLLAPDAESVDAAARFPAAAPPEAVDEGMLRAEEKLVVTGSVAPKRSYGYNVAQVVQRYAPGTLVQTGPGVPNWRYGAYDFSWSGPVDASQRMRFVVLSPVWLGLWRIAGSVLLAALFVLIVGASFGQSRLPSWLTRGRAVAPLLLLALLPLTELRAQTPDAAILQELRTRLTRAPECAPSCADLMHARVRASGDELDVVLDVSALESIAIPIPAAPNRWEPDNIGIDGQATAALYRDPNETRWIALRPGAHQVRLSGRIAAGDSVPLTFPMRPRTVDVSADGWDVSGVGDGRLLTGTIELVRKRTAAGATRMEAGREFPPFVRVHRTVVLDLDWSASTRVVRIAPEKGAFTLPVPLMPTESVLTEAIEVRDDRSALVAMPAGESLVAWASGLPRAENLELEYLRGDSRTEVWTFAVSPTWHVTFNGVPAVLPEAPDAAQWVFEFHPREGEKLVVGVSRPRPVEGATLAIDAVSNAVEIGKRVVNGSLEVRYRSTLGGRHTVALPEAVRVTAVASDGQAVALRPDRGELTLALLPGEHSFKVDWQLDAPIGLRSATPPIDLRTPASNITTRISTPADRWVLLAFGEGVGPAILFWSELAVFLGLALLIGGWRHSPLRTHEWLLLGLGLSTFSWSVLLVFAGWLFIMRWRETWSAAALSRGSFNLVQVGLALLSVIALASLVAAIPNGLLGTPDMRVAGSESSANAFSWFVDVSRDRLPEQGVISVSLWWWRAAMLAWALWLSFALLRWVPWAWRCWMRDGLWRATDAAPGRAAAEDVK